MENKNSKPAAAWERISGRGADRNSFPGFGAGRRLAEHKIGGNMAIQVEQGEGRITLSNGTVTVVYDKLSGKVRMEGKNGFALSNVHSAIKLTDNTIYDSDEEIGAGTTAQVKEIEDDFGQGKLLLMEKQYGDGKIFTRKIYLYEGLPYLITEADIKGQKKIGSNQITVLAAEKLTFPQGKDMRYLFTPFDNDDFIRYAALPFSQITESYEMSAVYDSVTRGGIVVGSVSHSTWKTGICAKQQGDNRQKEIMCPEERNLPRLLDTEELAEELTSLEGLAVVAGVTSKLTRDTLAHGTVYGTQINSPKVFLGFFEDYRDGLEAYGRANGIIAPPLSWEKGVVVGWNSWAAVATEINYDIYTKTSDFVKEELQSKGYSANGRVYINFDAFWDRLTEEERIAAAKHVRANGQIPGIYTTPFTFWGKSDSDGVVPGTDGKYHWQDILLKDSEGNILPAIDGGLCIDPTHPGNKMRVEWELNNFKRWGFEYVKMDFMAHGAVEGEHYDKTITTGIAAYNCGMQHINEILENEIKSQDFYISLSIAPIFPGQYAHGRRISCDVFGTINWTEYMLNSLTYGWWLNENVYCFNDPDHVVLYNSYNHREESMFHEGLSRFFSAAISGTMLLNSDDYREEAAKERAKLILTNKEILDIARAGKTFRPVEGNTGDQACDSFVRKMEDGTLYLAVFNFSNTEKKQMELGLERLGLEGKTLYIARDLWSGEEMQVEDSIHIDLEEAQPKIYLLKKSN